MRRLIYTSAASSFFSPSALSALMKECVANNSAHGITGMLIYHDGCFFQILEGNETAVEQCYSRISADRRHHSCIKLSDDVSKQRLFADWAMAYRPFDALLAAQQQSYIDLRTLVMQMKTGLLANDPTARVFLNAFLTPFRDLGSAA